MMKKRPKLVNILTVFLWSESSALILSFVFDSNWWKTVYKIHVFVDSFMELITQVLWLFLCGMLILGKLRHFPKIFISIFSTKKALWFSKPKFVRIDYASQFITFKVLNFLPSKIHPKKLGELFQFFHNYTPHKK